MSDRIVSAKGPVGRTKEAPFGPERENNLDCIGPQAQIERPQTSLGGARS